MPDFCTCGAQLPPDARFCHKCGKPQRDEPLLAELEAEAAPPPPPLPVVVVEQTPPPIGFHNGHAVWVALQVGITLFVLAFFSGVLTFLWLPLGGFFAVFLYSRRTGYKLNAFSGARLGWLAGICCFLLLVPILLIGLQQPEALDQLKEQLNKQKSTGSLTESDFNLALQMVMSPWGIGAMLFLVFVFFSLLPAFGGAMGARFLRGRPNPS